MSTGMVDSIIGYLGQAVETYTWSGIKTPAAQWYVCKTITIPAHQRRLILALNGNGQGGEVMSACNFNVTGSPSKSVTGNGGSKTGSGNNAVGWCYVETGATACTVQVRGYGYNTNVTNLNGTAVVIPI